MEPPYDQIISTLKGCFDSAGKIYPGSRDRAYNSAQAVLWVHIRALFISEGFAKKFPLPAVDYDPMSLDLDFRCLLEACDTRDTSQVFYHMYGVDSGVTPPHLQWTSNALVHLTWAMRDVPDTFKTLSRGNWGTDGKTGPLNTVLNYLLTTCIFLGWPVGEELLKIQDKTYGVPFLYPF